MTRKYSRLDFASALSFPSGVLTAAVGILWVHADNIARHPESYAEAPPTISRALWDPAIGAPFAWVMLISAVFLTIAVGQVALTFGRLIQDMPGRALNKMILGAFCICEATAIAGMIILSQYTGRLDSHLHDTGSFMLFFGHAIGISLSGWLVHRMRAKSPSDADGSAVANVLRHAARSPRHAVWVAIISAAFGMVYFGGKSLPEQYFFWQRLVLSVTEVIVILGFLAYLQSLWPLVRAGRVLRRGSAKVQGCDVRDVRPQPE